MKIWVAFSSVVPTVLYHGTTSSRFKRISKLGLHRDPKGVLFQSLRNYPISIPGVYLTTDPELALDFVLDKNKVLLGIDTSALDKSKLFEDENSKHRLRAGVSFRYDGDIPAWAISKLEP